jgi:hypothetical protein
VTRCMIALFLIGIVWATPAIASKKHEDGVVQIVGHVQFEGRACNRRGAHDRSRQTLSLFTELPWRGREHLDVTDPELRRIFRLQKRS